MDSRKYEQLEGMLCKELETIIDEGKISAGGLDTIHKLTDTIKNIRKIEGMDEEGSSYGGDWTARGNYSRGGYSDNGMSYARGRKHYVRGHYSYGNEKMAMMDKLEDMIAEGDMMPEDEKILRRAVEVLRK